VGTLLASLVTSRYRAAALVSRFASCRWRNIYIAAPKVSNGEASQFWSTLHRIVSRATDQPDLMDKALRVVERPLLKSSNYCESKCALYNEISVGKLPIYH